MKKWGALALIAIAVMLLQPWETQAQSSRGYSSIWDKIIDIVTWPARKYCDYILGNIVAGLTQNPTLYCVPGTECTTAPPPYNPAGCTCYVTGGMKPLMNKWLQILVPFYIIAMLFTGLFFLLKAGTPRGRARARGMFVKLLMGLVLVALAPVIYQALLELSKMFVDLFLHELHPTINLWFFSVPVDITLFGETNDHLSDVSARISHSGLSLACIFICLALIIYIIAGIMVWLRNIMVFFYGVFFPVIIFFYSFEVTKPQGQQWMNAALKWIFSPALQALILAFTIEVSERMTLLNFTGIGTLDEFIVHMMGRAMGGMVVLAGLLSFALAPMIVGQLMAWLGDAISAVGLGTGRQWMVGVGGILAGGGAGAIIQADAEYARGASYERYLSSMTSSPSLGPKTVSAPPKGATGSMGGGYGGYIAGGGGGAATAPSAPAARRGARTAGTALTPTDGGYSIDGAPTGSQGSVTTAGEAGYGGGQQSSGEGQDSAGTNTPSGAGGYVMGMGDNMSKNRRTGGLYSGYGSPEHKTETKEGGEEGGGGGFSPADVKQALDEDTGGGTTTAPGGGGGITTEDVAQARRAATSTDATSQQNVESTKGKEQAISAPNIGDGGLPQGDEKNIQAAEAQTTPTPTQQGGVTPDDVREEFGSMGKGQFNRAEQAKADNLTKEEEDKAKRFSKQQDKESEKLTKREEAMLRRLTNTEEQKRQEESDQEEQSRHREGDAEADRQKKAAAEKERQKNVDGKRR